jgi:hypothetical protein
MRADGSPAFPDPIQLASGESTQCRDEQAWKNLATEVRKKLPQFAGVALKKSCRTTHTGTRRPWSFDDQAKGLLATNTAKQNPRCF